MTSRATLPLVLAVAFALGCGGSDGDGPTNPNENPGGLAVTITAPANGATVSGLVDIAATVTGASGRPEAGRAALAGASRAPVVRFFVDGVEIGSDVAGPAYTLNGWDSRTVSDGSHAIRATATDGDENATHEISVTVDNGPGGGELSPSEIDLLERAFRGGFLLQSAVRDANELVARALFFASCSNGNQPTVTGTLTETAPGSEQFEYTPVPNDRLRVMFGNGVSVDIVLQDADGDIGGLECDDWLGFLRNHAVFDYSLSSPTIQVQVTSQVLPQDEFRRNVDQTVSGTVTDQGEVWTVQGRITGTEVFIFGESATNTHDTYEIQGELTSGPKRIVIQQLQDFRDDFFSNSGDSFTTQTDTIASSATDGTVVLGFDQAVYRWSDTNERSPIYEAGGSIRRGEEAIGALVTDAASGAVGIELVGGGIIPF